jgi:L-asparaginase
MQSQASTVVILGTGGTIAGTAASVSDNVGYTAAQLGVAALVAAVPALAAQALEAEQVAQLDSKDMDFATWQHLARRVAHHLARAEVAGVVITHGTDTLEETAYFLQRVLAPAKPVVLTAAMRPATSLLADGPQNLLDAVGVARHPLAGGVLAVLAGAVHGAASVRKRHSYHLDAFGSGDAGPVAWVEEGALRIVGAWPRGEALGVEVIARPVESWPRVEIVMSHAGARGDVVAALVGQGVGGIVVAGTGNGTLHHALEASLREAQRAGVLVKRCSRCSDGAVVGEPAGALPSAGTLSPVKARIELMLTLMA